MANIHIVALSGTQLTETSVGIDDVTGQITVPTLMPVNQDHLTTKEYVDQSVASFITQSALNTAVAGLAPQTEIVRIDAELALKADATDLADLSADVMHLIGGVMSGPIIYANSPQADDELVNKAYVDAAIVGGGGGGGTGGGLTEAQADLLYLRLDGGTMTGQISFPTDPVTDDHLTNKGYVDAQIAANIGGGGTALPADAVGYLHNDGAGNLDWGTPSGGGGGLPADAAGALTNNGTGNLTWVQYLTQTDGDSLYAPTLPADAAGALTNNGSGALTWTQYLTQAAADARYAPIGGGGTVLPADAAGMLVNDGSGGLSWGPTLHIVNAAPVDADGEDGDVFFVVP